MTTNADAIVGQAVHVLLWREGRPQRELAAALELDQSALSKKLRGIRSWTLDEVLGAASYLQVDVGELLPKPAEYVPQHVGRGRLTAAS